MPPPSPTPTQLVTAPSEFINPWKLGRLIDRDGGPVAGVSAGVLADVLEVHAAQTWGGAQDKGKAPSETPYRPYCTVPKEDGKVYRSFLPEDLNDSTEKPMRQLASTTKNPVVAARLFDILWVRFHHHQDAAKAIDALLDAAKLCTGERGWPDLVRMLGRASTLVIETNAKKKLPDLVRAVEAAGDLILAGQYAFGFGRLIDMVGATLLSAKSSKKVIDGKTLDKWIDQLQALAKRYAGDPHHGWDAYLVLQSVFAKLGRPKDQRAVQEQMVQALVAISDTDRVDLAATHLQKALGAAQEFGLPNLIDPIRHKLSRAVRGSVAHFKPVSIPIEIPATAFQYIEELVQHAPSVPVALRQLSVASGLLNVPLDEFNSHAQERLKEQAFWRLIPGVQYSDGKVTFRANDDAAKTSESMSLSASTFQLVDEALVAHFLRLTSADFDDNTLFDALAEWPHLDPNRHPLLRRASERFARSDYISSGVIVVTLYEAVLRDLLRALGYSALKADTDGILKDETLNSLLQNSPIRDILGEQHIWFVEHVLCRPHLGPNMRNLVAHGTATVVDFTPMRVLLVWLFLIRLTSVVATPPDHPNAKTVAKKKNKKTKKVPKKKTTRKKTTRKAAKNTTAKKKAAQTVKKNRRRRNSSS